MKKRFLALALLAAIAAVPVGSNAAPAFSCSGVTGYTTVNKTPAASNGHVDTIAPKTAHRYTFSVTGAGDHHLLAQPINGDIDILVCKNGAPVCTSGNGPATADGCLIVDQDLNGGWPGMGKPLPGPGTYVAWVWYCTGTDCGYPADPGVPVAYGIGWR